MQEPTPAPDSFNWPERPSSSDSAPDVKLEQASDLKAFYVPSSSTATPPFTCKPASASAAPPPIRRHSSSGAQLRRSKHPYSPSLHEARIRNKYGGEVTKMSGNNYSQWIKSENGECYISSFQKRDLMFHRRSRKTAGVRIRHVWSPGTVFPPEQRAWS
jgi:hypothetical protein